MKNALLGLLSLAMIGLASCKDNTPVKVEDAVKAHGKGAPNANYPLLNKAGWILGSWKGVIGQGTSVEVWTRRNDSSYLGASLFIKGNVSYEQESITLLQRGNELFYIPTVKDQNNGQPVPFKMTKLTDKEMVFENPVHDFPQKISYTLVTVDSLVATISGMDKGKAHSEHFPMKKDKKQ